MMLLPLHAAVRRPEWLSEAAEVPSFFPASTGRLDDVQMGSSVPMVVEGNGWLGEEWVQGRGRTAAETLKT